MARRATIVADTDQSANQVHHAANEMSQQARHLTGIEAVAAIQYTQRRAQCQPSSKCQHRRGGCKGRYQDDHRERGLEVLRQRMAALPAVESRLGWTVKGVTQSATSVRVTAVEEKTGREEVLEADYAVGCDGSHSMVRGQIGIERSGEDYDTLMVLAVLRSKELHQGLERFPGRSTYRGLVHIPKTLRNCRNNTECDALLINEHSRTDTYPAITVRGDRNYVQHEASVSKVNEEMIFYMQQRGLTEGQAMSLAVNGFINDLARQFPMEYSVELKRLIDLEMEGSVG